MDYESIFRADQIEVKAQGKNLRIEGSLLATTDVSQQQRKFCGVVCFVEPPAYRSRIGMPPMASSSEKHMEDDLPAHRIVLNSVIYDSDASSILAT